MKNPHYIPPEMVFVQGGKMQLGEKRELAVNLPDFWIGKYPVTNDEFVHFLNAKGNQKEAGKKWCLIDDNFGIEALESGTFQLKSEKRKHPVIQVSWYGASAYCQWLSEQTGENYQLPSETQWEYSARGGQQSKGFVYAGSNKTKEIGWYRNNSYSQTKPVGLKLGNEMSIHDLSGNVWEWCADIYNNDFSKTWTDGKPQENKTTNYDSCVLRGGSWDNFYTICRIAARDTSSYPNLRSNFVGFRVSRC